MEILTNNLTEIIAWAVAFFAAMDKIFMVAMETLKSMRTAWRSTFPKKDEDIIELIEEV